MFEEIGRILGKIMTYRGFDCLGGDKVRVMRKKKIKFKRKWCGMHMVGDVCETFERMLHR